MRIVNNLKIETFDIIDTEFILKNRIAAKLNTLSKYLYFPEPLDINVDTDITVIDILKIIKSSKNTSISFNDLIIQLNDKMENITDIKKDILTIWIIYNKELENIINNDIHIENLYDGLNIEEYMNLNDLQKIWKTRVYLRTQFEKIIKDFIVSTNSDTINYNKFIVSECNSSDIIVKSASVNISFNIGEINILELFNKIILNKRFPYAYCDNYYKILKDFDINEDWITNENNLSLYMCIKKDIENASNTDYIKIEITVENNIVVAEVNIVFLDENLNSEEFSEELLNLFQLKEVKYDIINNNIKGSFSIYDSNINYHVISDLAMNDTLISRFLYIDESNKATKSRLFIYFKMPEEELITVEIKNCIKNRIENEEEFFIDLNVNGKDLENLKRFKKIFVKFCAYYEDKKETIIDLYRDYLDDETFGSIIIEEKQAKHKMFRDIDKDIFIKGYTKMCEKHKRPEILSDEEIKNLKEIQKKHTVIKFPRNKLEDNDDNIKYASDGKNQKYYSCYKNTNFPHIGVRKSKLENSNEYPYLPCCYKTNRTENNKDYYDTSKKTVVLQKKQQSNITTNKILSKDTTGFLSKNIKNFFSLIDNNSNHQYLRYGVIRSRKSFIYCLMKITEQDKNIKKKTIDAIISEISSEKNINISKQCNYDKNTDVIRNDILNKKSYFNPHLYVQLLEYFFKRNIILFNNNSMFLPNYTQTYYKPINKGNYVFIYEHMGSESDNSSYPQCELIIRDNIDKKQIQIEFTPEDNVSKNINILYKKMYQAYTLNNIVNDTEIPKENIIDSQIIDAYGKTRCVNIEYKNSIVSLFTSPVAPFAVKEIEQNNINKLSVKEIDNFVKFTNICLSGQVINNNYIKELVGKWGTIDITIPIQNNSKPIDGLKVYNNSFNDFQSKESKMKLFNYNEKMARYLIEHMFWLFSKYLENEKIQKITDKDLDYFQKNFFTIIENYKYGEKHKKEFSKNNIFFNNDKLITTSIEMIKKLMYVLKLQTIRNLSDLINYKDRKFIKEYYNDISDFDEYTGQIILYKKDSVLIWIQQTNNIYTLYDTIDNKLKVPYFFRNKKINDNKVLLAQNSDSLLKALNISQVWNKNHYNIGLYTENTQIIPFNFYTYENKNTIVLHEIEGGNSDIVIVGYKVDDQKKYTTLLEL